MTRLLKRTRKTAKAPQSWFPSSGAKSKTPAEPDTADERAEKDRLIAEFIASRGVTKCKFPGA